MRRNVRDVSAFRVSRHDSKDEADAAFEYALKAGRVWRVNVSFHYDSVVAQSRSSLQNRIS